MDVLIDGLRSDMIWNDNNDNTIFIINNEIIHNIAY